MAIACPLGQLRCVGALALLLLTAGPAGARDEMRHLEIAGTTRSYTIYVPDRLGRAAALPGVVVLHGGVQTGREIRELMRMDAVADREGFLVAYPEGLGQGWNDGRLERQRQRGVWGGADDVAFLKAMVGDMAAQGWIDPARVYLTGVSNGGMMALRAGCDLAQVFAAIAPVIANLPADILVTCKPARPLPILIMNGTRDPLVPWHGGGVGFAGARGKVLATETTLAFWIANNGCEGDPDLERRPKRSGESSAVVLKRWTACRAGAPVVLVEIEGGGHRIPGREDRPHPAIDLVFGVQNHDIEAAEVVWRFFAPALLPSAHAGR